ncbi:hypothetical protein IVA95_30135 [Bradyrhizobium sp. 157]|jgi:hypothetical protein|uniref:hypothetical protein n=1 Tax=Bradyrhizobium sp. 157 TaxID=2782631 RepID=UPI001FF99AB2|nr:hypothetical protein [Bradyrhizobium sp. 157]MCK1641689.1 hypothetical protein [Bradyrhizobium sp. 157]
MFVRLTRPVRVKAGWFAALLYLFCVLAPGAALALGEAASCLVHQLGTAAAAHVHDGAQPEHEASHQHHANADHVMPGHAGHQHDGNASPGPCCAVLCVSAIAADPPAVAKPSPPVSLCAAEDFQRLPGEAPPLLYRPPIA